MRGITHLLFNICIIVFPWLSVLFLGKRNIKRFYLASLLIVIFEIINHKIGQKRNWWLFYNRKKSFLINELPFSIGPYMPVSMWILKFTYGNFKKFLAVNAIYDAIFAFVGMKVLQKMKIIKLHRINDLQFFFYIFYKAFLLYGVQIVVEKFRSKKEAAY